MTESSAVEQPAAEAEAASDVEATEVPPAGRRALGGVVWAPEEDER